MTKQIDYEKTDYPASLFRRGIAFIIDCFISVVPIIVICLFFLNTFPKDAVILSPAPILGTLTVYEMPLEVSDALNVIDNGDGTSYTVAQNVSFAATSIRIISVLSLVFYVLYTTFCTYLYGKTIGKKLLGIEVVHSGGLKPVFWCLLRETFGKVLLNTTIIVPIISCITILVTPKHKAIHDFIGNTTVVETLG